jgi:hypothetical protein
MRWTTVLLTVLLGAGATAAAAAVYGHWRWRSLTTDIRTRLEGSRQAIEPSTYDPRELEYEFER